MWIERDERALQVWHLVWARGGHVEKRVGLEDAVTATG